LAEDERHAEHGTQIFHARKKWGFNKHYVSLTREAHKVNLSLHCTIPYLPNSMMAFVNTPIAFHENPEFTLPARKCIQSHIRLFPDTFHKLYKPLGPKLRDRRRSLLMRRSSVKSGLRPEVQLHREANSVIITRPVEGV
jgi:hypothetical protein